MFKSLLEPHEIEYIVESLLLLLARVNNTVLLHLIHTQCRTLECIGLKFYTESEKLRAHWVT